MQLETNYPELEPRGSDAPDALRGYPGLARRTPRKPFTLDRVIRFVLGLGLLAIVGGLLWTFSGLVVYLLLGMILAYLLGPSVDRMQGLGFGRISAILVTFVVVFGVISMLLTYLVPFIAQQLRDISQLVTEDTIADIAAYIQAQLADVLPGDQDYLGTGFLDAFETLFQQDRIARFMRSVLDVFTNIFYAVLVVPFIAFFLLKDGAMIRQSLLRLVPNRYFEVTLAIVEKVETDLGRYFRGLLIQCLSVATVASVLLYVVGLNYALAVGVFTGVANSIPYFGPAMGFLAGTLVSIAQTGNLSLIPGVLVAMALTQTMDNLFFQPLIFSKAARAHPLIILFVVLMGAQLAGIVGMLVAIPLATIVRVTIVQLLWSLRNYRILRSPS